MKVEKDFLMRKIKDMAKNLGSFLSKESIKEFINYDLSSQERLNDEEIDQLLLVSFLKETIEMNQLSESFVQSKIGLNTKEIKKAYNLEINISDKQYQEMN